MRKIHVEHTIPAPKHAFIIWNCLDFFFTTIIHSQVKMVHCTRHPPPQPTLSVSLASKSGGRGPQRDSGRPGGLSCPLSSAEGRLSPERHCGEWLVTNESTAAWWLSQVWCILTFHWIWQAKMKNFQRHTFWKNYLKLPTGAELR